ncbi:MAG: hypothetical protein U0838_17565 [Chloroflexota bacterium]
MVASAIFGLLATTGTAAWHGMPLSDYLWLVMPALIAWIAVVSVVAVLRAGRRG